MIRIGALLALPLVACLGSAPGDGGNDLAMPGNDGALPDLAAPPDLTVAPTHAWLYVGGYGAGITRVSVDLTTGALNATGLTTLSGSPSFLALGPGGTTLYAARESASRVSAFTLDARDGTLAPLDDQPSGGSGPAHVSVAPSGGYLFLAHYGDGTLATFGLTTGGTLAPSPQLFVAGKNAHQAMPDATSTRLYVPCLGIDAVQQYAIGTGAAPLSPLSPPSVATAAGAGPRHLALHPTLRRAYLIDETASTMTALAIAADGTLSPLQTLSTLPAGFTGTNTGAEVALHPNGRVLYGSNRGDDSIVRYALDASGAMTVVDHTKTGGTTPRHFSLDPRGRWLAVANQGTGTVTLFAVDAGGALTRVGTPLAVTGAAFAGAWIDATP